MTNCVRLSDSDNVVTTIAPIAAGDTISIEGSLRLSASETIPIYHKASIAPIPKGSKIFKYGQAIGVASVDIAAGAHVHTQNLVSESDYRGGER